MTTEAVNVVKVVTRLRDLARDPNNQPIITIDFLSTHPDNRALLVQEKNLLFNLFSLYTHCVQQGIQLEHVTEDSVLETLGRIWRHLAEHVKDDDVTSRGLDATAFSDMLQRYSLKLGQKPEGSKPQGQIELTKKHNVHIFVEKLRTDTEAVKLLLQDTIMKLPGTISYTFNVEKQRISLYTRTPTDKIMDALGKKASALGRVDMVSCVLCESELKRSDPAAPAGSAGEAASASEDRSIDKENRDYPQYLSPEKQTRDDSQYKKSLMVYGGFESLEERMANRRKKQEKKQEKKKEEEGFLTKITSLRFW